MVRLGRETRMPRISAPRQATSKAISKGLLTIYPTVDLQSIEHIMEIDER